MNKKWREAMITEINRLNTVTTTPVVPLAPAALAPASVVAGNQKLAATQINENEKIASVAYHDAAGKAIRVENNGKQVAVMDAVGATV